MLLFHWESQWSGSFDGWRLICFQLWRLTVKFNWELLTFDGSILGRLAADCQPISLVSNLNNKSYQWVVNVDISYGSKRRSMSRKDGKLAARVRIVKAQCSATIDISEGWLQYMQTSEIIKLCIVMLRWVRLLSLSLSFLLMTAIKSWPPLQAKCIKYDNLYQMYSHLFFIHLC